MKSIPDLFLTISTELYLHYVQDRQRFPFPTVRYLSPEGRLTIRVRRKREDLLQDNGEFIRKMVQSIRRKRRDHQQRGKKRPLSSPLTSTLLLLFWGLANAFYWEIWKGYPACSFCRLHRNTYLVLLIAIVFFSLFRKKWIFPLLFLPVLVEIAISCAQMLSSCRSGLCRAVSLPEKINFLLACGAGSHWVLSFVSRIIAKHTSKNNTGRAAGHCGPSPTFFLPLLFLFFSTKPFLLDAGKCTGRHFNPISDICWKCIFPIRIAGQKVVSSKMPDPDSPKTPICFCRRGVIPAVPGVPISFWEPIRLVEITRTPYCLVSLGGTCFAKSPTRGEIQHKKQQSFYQVHWYIYPAFFILELLTDFLCIEKKYYDLAYITELDPLWNNDAKSAIINPEALLFGNILAQTACLADCAQASVTNPNGALFWCAGCQGSMYPFTGSVGAHNGGVQGSLLLASRMIAKLHREGLLHKTIGKGALCGPCFAPIIPKQQYRLQMTYPLPETKECKRIGQSELLWQAGKEYPVKGEDFAYLVWRRRDCCLTPF